MHLATAFSSILLLATTAMSCLQADFYYEQDNHQRLYGKLKDNGAAICGIAMQGAMREYYSLASGRIVINLRNKCEELVCLDHMVRGRICREFPDFWRVEIERNRGMNWGGPGRAPWIGAAENWERSSFGLMVQDKGNDERRLTEAVWGCSQAQIDGVKGLGFPGDEVHA